MRGGHRNHPAYWAFVLHRLSGVGLFLFLPLHFLTLGLALESHAALDSALSWFESPLVKAAEYGLVVLLAAHLLGGLRLLAVEFLPWRDWQRPLIGLVFSVSILVGVLSLMAANL
jgi:fumarate reductase subunit D